MTRSQLRALCRANPAFIQVLRVHRLRRRAIDLFPGAPLVQEAWVQACLRLRQIGARRPRVHISCAHNTATPRTLREARFQGATQ